MKLQKGWGHEKPEQVRLAQRLRAARDEALETGEVVEIQIGALAPLRIWVSDDALTPYEREKRIRALESVDDEREAA